MSAYDNLKIKCIAMGKGDKSYIEGLLSLVGLSDVGSKQTKNFSLGMKQRLGIALALVGEPEIMILDEPINDLDPQGIVEVREILTKLSKEKGITIIISSHILDELAKIADSYGIIHEGKIIDEMTSEQLEQRCGEFVVVRTENNEKAVEILRSEGYDNISMPDDIDAVISIGSGTGEIIRAVIVSVVFIAIFTAASGWLANKRDVK